MEEEVSAPVIRTLLERFSRDRIIKRRLPRQFGSREIYVSPDSALQYWKRDLSSVAPALFDFANKLVRPGDVVWDIGANVGLFAFCAAACTGKAGKVLAVEPDPWLGALLRRSAEIPADASPVTVLSVATAEHSGIVEFNIASRGRSSNFVSGAGAHEHGGSRSSFPVVAVTFDWLAEQFGQPSIIKIDVEGMELSVLRGAAKVLESRPILILEVLYKHRAEVGRMLMDLGYRLAGTDLQFLPPILDSLPLEMVALPTDSRVTVLAGGI